MSLPHSWFKWMQLQLADTYQQAILFNGQSEILIAQLLRDWQTPFSIMAELQD